MSNLALTWLDKELGAGYSTVQSAGSSAAQETTVNFTGAVSVTDDPIAGVTTVNIVPGGPSGGGLTFLSASGGSAVLTPAAGVDSDCAFSQLTANGQVTLPAAPTKGQRVRTAILDATGLSFSVTVQGNGKAIGTAGASSYAVNGGGVSVEIVYDGTQWWVRQKNEPRKPPIDANTVIEWLLNEPKGASSWANSGTAGTFPIGAEALYGTVNPRGGPLPAGLDFALAEIGTASTSTGESAGDFCLIATINKRSDPASAQAHIVGKRHANNTAWSAPQISAGIAMNNSASPGSWRAYFTQAGGSLDSLDAVAPFMVFADAEPCMVSLRFTKSTGRFDMSLCGDVAATKVGAMGAGVGIDWGTHGAWYLGGIPTGSTQCFDGMVYDVRVLGVAPSDTYLKTLWDQASGQLNLAV